MQGHALSNRDINHSLRAVLSDLYEVLEVVLDEESWCDNDDLRQFVLVDVS
jgi:hypothetical protein